MEPPAKRAGRFDWSSCNNSDLAALLASRVITADNGGLDLAFQLACVNKELYVAIKAEVKKELAILQSLYEEYRKLVLAEEKMRNGGPTEPAKAALAKSARDQSFKDFEVKFRQLINSKVHYYPTHLIGSIERLQREQKEICALDDSDQFVISKFGFTFEDYMLVAHMCRSVCMLSSSMSTLDNWIAKRGEVMLQWPFAQQKRLGCVVPTFYFQHTMYNCSESRLPSHLESKFNNFSEVSEVLTGRAISLNAVTMQYNSEAKDSQRVELALTTMQNKDLGLYKKGRFYPEIPFFPSALVPRENSVAGRLKLTDLEIKRAKEQAARHEEAVAEEKRLVLATRMRRYNDDASAWLKMKGHALTIEQALRILDADGGNEAQTRWEEDARKFIETKQLGKPTDNLLHVLKRLDVQLRLRDKILKLTGELLAGRRVLNFCVERECPFLSHDFLVQSQPIDDLAVAVEHVVHKIRTGETSIELRGEPCKDLRWIVDLGNGIKLEQSLPGVDKDGRVRFQLLASERIRRIFRDYNQECGTDVEPMSLSLIDRAKELICGMKKRGKNQKDWGAELIRSITKLDRAVREKTGFSFVIFRIFCPEWSMQIRDSLMDLHSKWKTMRCAALPAKCPLNTHDFVLELVGNPLNLPIKYIGRPAPRPSTEEMAKREARLQAVLEQIPQMESSDDEDDDKMDTGAGPSGYAPTSPQYQPA
jgi:uncharacterized protein YxjI